MKVTLIAAISLDGFITRHDEPGSGFTSREDKCYFQDAVLDFDALVFGSNNYEQSKDWIANSLRPDQLKIVLTRDPERYGADRREGELEFTDETPAEVVEMLKSRGRQRTCLMGGGQIYGLFLAAGVVDELWITVEPVLFGEGVKLAEARLDKPLELISQENLNASTLLLKYRPTR
jgi:dihydrofolate reductase